ncbi:MAG: lysylphosphatidylglycerol synthase transmembrane domain-containing protein [Chloroflexota bacterium]
MFRSKKVGAVLQLLFSFVLLAGLIWLVGWDALVMQLSALAWTWYLLAFGLYLLSVALRAYRWFVLLNSLNKRPSFTHLLYLYYVGFFANNFIPSGFGGDVVKVVSLRQSYGRGAEALSSVLMDRIIGLLGSSLLALVALLWNVLAGGLAIELVPAIWLTIILVSVGIPVAFGLMRWTEPVKTAVRLFPFLQKIPKFNKLEELADTVRRYPLSALLKSLSVSLPFTACLVLAHFSIAKSLGVDLPLSIFSLFVPIIAIVGLLPISFNGLGVREGLYQFLYVPIGVPDATALAMSLALYFLRFGTGLVGGLLYAGRNVAGLWAAGDESPA